VASPLAQSIFDDGELGRAAAARATWLLVILGVSELATVPGAAASGLLRGRKDTKAPMFHTLIGSWLVGLPLALWLSAGLDLGVIGMWFALGLGTLVAAILSLGRLRTRLGRIQADQRGA
jgi:MATE family multidrug resistance protein